MRLVPEWLGLTDDSNVPIHVRMRVLIDGKGRCSKCDHKFVPGDPPWQCDHIKPLWLGGENRESNMQILCVACHKKKTGGEAGIRAKTNRVRQKHFGLRKDRTIRAWRNFKGEIVRAGRER